MKLIDLLVKHLGNNGGWPIGAEICAQDNDCEVVFYSAKGIHRSVNNLVWTIPAGIESKVVKRRIFIALAEDLQTAIVSRSQYEAALAASQQPAWNGDGLPPVGCECEVKRAIDWMRCKILFISESHVVLRGEEECCWQTQACQFRKIRTEAERKRDEFAKSLADKSVMGEQWQMQSVGRAIYDAIASGKIHGVKLE